MAERAGMSPMTLSSIERGGDGVTMGAYLAVMQVLGIEQDINLLGQSDPLGRDLPDARLLPQSRPRAKSCAAIKRTRKLTAKADATPLSFVS